MQRRLMHIARGAVAAFSLLWGATAGAASAPLTLDQLAVRLGQAPVVSGRFEQHKTLRALRRPLVSRGELVVVRGQGIVWQVTAPYQAAVALRSDRIVERDGEGRQRVRDAQDVPGLFHVGQLLQALLQGEYQALTQYFDVAAAGTLETWRVTLQPKPALAGALTALTAKGGVFLEEVTVEEANGDRTVIVFTGMQGGNTVPDQAAEMLGTP